MFRSTRSKIKMCSVAASLLLPRMKLITGNEIAILIALYILFAKRDGIILNNHEKQMKEEGRKNYFFNY